MNKTDFHNISSAIPKQPGVYKFIGIDSEILYVGKAKNLKNRLSSYFMAGKSRTYKTRLLVRQAEKVEYTLVDTEHDALLLENNLIKEHQPRFNVTWRDDKTYTYICVKKERFPRVFFTRRVIRDGSTYFGPYSSKWKARIVFDQIKRLFPLRTCSLNLSPKNIEAGKFKVCLEYHIRNCAGPCVGLESEEVYNARIGQVKNMLRGQLGEVKDFIRTQMKQSAGNLNFERAQELKEKLDVLLAYHSKSTVISTVVQDVDVFNIADDEKTAYVHYLKVVDGSVVHSHTIELTKNLNDDPEDILRFAIPLLRATFRSESPEMIVPFELTVIEAGTTVTVPKRGDKKKLLDLAAKNVQYFLMQKRKEEAEKRRKITSAERILNTMKDDLQMEEIPLHIECFDNSNIQGSNPVAACVVFRNAKPSKKDYRKFHIKTVKGPNDFASMEEVVFRRYFRLIKEEKALPQLIIIDGGKGQLHAAVNSLQKLGIEERVTIVGIAKRLEEIFFPGDSIPIYINKKSESLKLIQQCRNEAHRFAIGFHRDMRSKNFLGSTLTDIPGVGEKSAEKLLSKFGSVERIRKASKEELSAVTSPSIAKKVHEWMSQSSQEEE